MLNAITTQYRQGGDCRSCYPGPGSNISWARLNERIQDESARPSRIGQGFDPRRDVDAVAVEVVALDDHVAEIDADAQLDAAVRRDTRVPLGHRLLHRDRATHRIDDAGKLHQHAVAGGRVPGSKARG